MSLIHKEPFITPEMVAAWNNAASGGGDTGWVTPESNYTNAKYRVKNGVVTVVVVGDGVNRTWSERKIIEVPNTLKPPLVGNRYTAKVSNRLQTSSTSLIVDVESDATKTYLCIYGTNNTADVIVVLTYLSAS